MSRVSKIVSRTVLNFKQHSYLWDSGIGFLPEFYHCTHHFIFVRTRIEDPSVEFAHAQKYDRRNTASFTSVKVAYFAKPFRSVAKAPRAKKT